MSKSKKNTRNDQHNSVDDRENKLNRALDNKSEKTSDCHNDKAQNKSESSCR